MTVGHGRDWKRVLGSIAGDASERIADRAPIFSSDSDGDAYAWSWRRTEEDLVEEVRLRAAPDPLEAGLQTQLLALARRQGPPLLAWSAVTWTRHLEALTHDNDGMHLQIEDLDLFRSEFPERLLEAFAKVDAVSPHLGELEAGRQLRLASTLESVRHLLGPEAAD